MLALVCTVGGCGDDLAGAGTTNAGLDRGPWDPELCSPMAQTQVGNLPGTCTQADFDAWNACLIDACQGTFERCYGPGYRTGAVSGPCEPFVSCAVKCQCDDAACLNRCPGTQECGSCLQTHVCGGDCPDPACALAGTGIDTSKTCEDLKRCCVGLSDPAHRAECLSSADQLAGIPAGELVCAGFYTSYATISPTCE